MGGLKRKVKDISKIILPEFFDLGESSIDLVAHGGNNIINWDHVLLVDESFGPDFGVDLIAFLEMHRNVLFGLGDFAQFL